MGARYEKIKAAAKAKGLTVTGVEKQLGFARGSLSKIDEHKPSLEKAAMLSELLGIPIEELTSGITVVFGPKSSIAKADLVAKMPAAHQKYNKNRIAEEVLKTLDKTIPDDPEGFPVYYTNEETARAAQEVFDDPDTRMLFDAARNASPEAIRLAAEMLKTFKKTNPDW